MTSPDKREGGPPPFGIRFMAPLALGSMLNPINSTMLSTALVPIAESLHAGVDETGWLIAGLYLTTAVAQPTMGRLVDLFGPRRIYLLSLAFVAAAGIFGSVTSSLTSLVMVRVLLGIGTSGAYPAAMRIFRVEAARIGAKPPRIAMGVLNLAAISTMAVGPVVGGLLTSAFGWHAIFSVNAPLAVLAVILILLWIPQDEPRTARFSRLVEEVDLVGVGLFAVSLLSLTAFLMTLRSRPLWLALAIAGAFGAVLVVHSLRRLQPFIDVRMLARNRPLVVTYLRAGAVSMIVFSVYYGFAQWLQSVVGLGAAEAGLVTLPMSIVAAVSSLTGARTKGLRAPMAVGIGAAVIGCICLLIADRGSPIWFLTVAVTFFGVPLGSFSTATQAAVYIQAPAEEIGAAAGLQRTAMYVGAMAAASLLAMMYGQRATDHGLHSLAAAMGALSAVLFIITLFDRTIPAVSKSDETIVQPQTEIKTMPLTQLDAVPALVVIDLQKGIVGLPTAQPASEIVDRSARLARAFREHGLPVVLVNVAGRAPGRTDAGPPKFTFPPDWTDLVPELEPQPDDYLVTKQRVGAFIGTSLHDQLAKRGVTQIVLAGIATSVGVESTARSAYDHGYNVTLVGDAMTDLDADAHRHSVEKVFPRLGEVATTDDVLLQLKNGRA